MQVDGLLVQLPFPPQIDEKTICDAVVPEKDVDGFHVLNIGTTAPWVKKFTFQCVTMSTHACNFDVQVQLLMLG